MIETLNRKETYWWLIDEDQYFSVTMALRRHALNFQTLNFM
jgi:hypothetical protein